MSRTQKAFKNAIFSVMTYIVTLVLTFLSQRFFIQYLGYDLLGINSLFTTIITTLSVAELGIGVAITFSLYQPLANEENNKVSLLINLYKRIYRIIALIVLVVGLAVIPFLPLLTQYAFTLAELAPIYLIFLINSFISYFFTFNHTLLIADQKSYLNSFFTMLTKISIIITQIIILILTKSFILYLLSMLIFTALFNIVLSRIVIAKYPHIKRSEGKLEKEETDKIKQNVFALIYHKIGNYLVTGTDNLIISAFLGVTIVGYYANYVLLTTAMSSLIMAVFAGVTAGFGNLIVNHEKRYVNQVFKKARFIGFGFYAIAANGLFVLANTLILIWIGGEPILSTSFLIIFTLNFYITGYSVTLGNIRAAAGAFAPDRYIHIVIAVLNLVISMVLVNFIGIIGVLLGTTISLLIKECIVLPRIGSKYIYDENPSRYYLRFLFDMAVCVGMVALSTFIYSLISFTNLILQFAVGVVICVAVPAVILTLVYFKTNEFKYCMTLAKGVLNKLLNRNKNEENINDTEN